MSSGQMVEEEQLDGLFNQYQAILAEANNSWLQVKGDEAHGKDDQSAEGHG